jgi:NADPH-dependent 2,4-dienoyl-CoA reductase/sulfur reductase-like enzyme
MSDQTVFDVAIVGAGPAGIAAALSASVKGTRVALIDDNDLPGGQIYRAIQGEANPAVAGQIEEIAKHGVVRFDNTAVYDAPAAGVLAVNGEHGTGHIQYENLILATGARELFLPFPGWTLPNVMGVGGLQALVKEGLDVQGKRIVLAGSGPLLMAVGAYLLEHGARVVAIAEQAPVGKLARFGSKLVRMPSKLAQGAQLMRKVGTRVKFGSWIESAEGGARLERVTLRSGYKTRLIECDYLGCAFGFVPNLEMPLLLGCDVERGFVKVDDQQQTSIEGVYCAGEPTGIGGIDLSVVEGRIAGLASTGQENLIHHLRTERTLWRQFAVHLDRAFALRQELRELSASETVVCRCEDVRMGQLVGWESSRAAKLQTRCGMGACQGRICGPATRFLFNWEHGSVRPPLSPVPLAGFEKIPEAERKTN